jgi:predicted transcriptional regulator
MIRTTPGEAHEDIVSAGVLSYAPVRIFLNEQVVMTHTQLQRLLDAANLSQSEAARELGINPRSMRRYLVGEIEIPRMAEVAIKCITGTWSPTLELREVNARLRHIDEFAEKELEKIAGGAEDCRRIARNALKRIVDIRAGMPS